jgi:hypothetical protein
MQVYCVAAVINGRQGPLTAIVAGKPGPRTRPFGFDDEYSIIGDNSEGDCGVGSVGTDFDEGTGAITMRSGGEDIWCGADDFTFLHRRVSGDFRVTVKMLTEPTATSPWSKAGPMIREDLSRGAARSATRRARSRSA